MLFKRRSDPPPPDGDLLPKLRALLASRNDESLARNMNAACDQAANLEFCATVSDLDLDRLGLFLERTLLARHPMGEILLPVFGTLASFLTSVHRHAACLRLIDDMMLVARRHLHPSAEFAACVAADRGAALAGLGRFDEADTEFAAAIPVLEREGDAMRVHRCRMVVAEGLKERGLYKRALAEIELLLRSRLDERVHAEALLRRGLLMQELGRYAESLTDLSSARKAFKKLKEPVREAQARCFGAIALSNTEQHDEAEDELTRALETLKRFRLASDAASCLINRAAARAQRHRFADAETDVREALSLLSPVNDAEKLSGARLNHAAYLNRLGRHAEALDVLAAADTTTMMPVVLSHWHSERCSTLLLLGRLDEAARDGEASMAGFRSALRSGGIGETDLVFLDYRRKAIDGAVLPAIEAGNVTSAHAAICAGKAAVLGGFFDGARTRRSTDARDLHQARRSVGAWLRETSGSQRAALPDDVYYPKIREFVREFERSLSQGPDGEAAALPTIGDIRRSLCPGWAILDFWVVGPAEIAVIVITPETAAIRRIRTPSVEGDLKTCLSAIRADVSALARGEATLLSPWDGLTAIHHTLFEAFASDLDGLVGVYLVPHYTWNRAPLHACGPYDPMLGRERWLADRLHVAYLPSAAMLPALGAAPLSGGQELHLLNPERGSASTLPFAESLGAGLVPCPSADFRNGPAARFDAVRDWSGKAFVHFAAHGISEPRYAPLSHIRLADDLLLTYDVLHHLPGLAPGACVLLNGCETAVPDARAIDESFSLAAAFLARGASTVVATDWPVTDLASLVFSQAFVSAWRMGKGPARALSSGVDGVRGLTRDDALDLCSVRRSLERDADSPELHRIDAVEAFVRSSDELPFAHPIFWSSFRLIGRAV